LPGFIAAWYLSGAPAPEALDMRSIVGVSYLVICGTVVGATLFFYVLRHCSALTTSLIPLMTPMLAIYVGVMVDGEAITATQIVGSLMIVSSLGLYQGIWKRLRSHVAIASPEELKSGELPGLEREFK
jgi:drug/metabolite transporter (DMT)-like permease